MTPIVLAAGACALGVYSMAHAAQVADPAAQFPARPVRVVVGFTPGGQPDIVARLISPKLAEFWQQQVVVDNRPGAGGIIGTKIVADATPDGHTLLIVSGSHANSPAIHAKLPYDTLRDFAGVTMTVSSTYVLAVSPAAPLKSPQDLMAMAKAKPGQFNFASAGVGSGTHFAAELFKLRAGVDVVHVPYKGIPEAMTDTMTGRVQFMMTPLASSLTLVREGRLRALAVTAAKRVAVHPDVPTLAESGLPGFQWDAWGGLIAPVKTPRAIIDKLNRDVTRALRLSDVQSRIAALGMETIPGSPAAFDKRIADEVALVVQIARKAGIQPQ